LYSASISGKSYLERKYGLDLQIVGDDLLADLQGQVSLVEVEGKAACQAHATNSDDALASCQRKLACGQVRAYLLQIRSALYGSA